MLWDVWLMIVGNRSDDEQIACQIRDDAGAGGRRAQAIDGRVHIGPESTDRDLGRMGGG
jgi:hypothetical protein